MKVSESLGFSGLRSAGLRAVGRDHVACELFFVGAE